jgi:hypothetical protein
LGPFETLASAEAPELCRSSEAPDFFDHSFMTDDRFPPEAPPTGPVTTLYIMEPLLLLELINLMDKRG